MNFELVEIPDQLEIDGEIPPLIEDTRSAIYEEQRTAFHPANADVEVPPSKVAIVEIPEGDRARQALPPGTCCR